MSGLRVRLAATLALIAGLAGLLAVAVASLVVQRASGRAHSERLQAYAHEQAARLEDEFAAFAGRLQGVERWLRGEPERLARWFAGTPDGGSPSPLDAPRELAGFAWLSLAGPDGIVLSCSPQAELAGLRDPLAGVAVPRAVAGERFVWSHAFEIEARRFTLRGAVPLARFGSSTETRSFELAARAAPPPATPAGWRVEEVAVPGAPFVFRFGLSGAGRERLVGRVALWGAGGALLLALAGALAGGWAAGRVVRPIRDLVRAVDRIRAGEADYTFPAPAGHELEELTRSFSLLHRSLEEQQGRALAAERVAAWRETARRVAHEVKNPLMPIRLTMENLIKARGRSRETFDSMFDDGARTVLEEVEQLRRLVGEFSEFARLPEPDRRAAEPEELVNDVLALYAGHPGIRFERERGLDGRTAQLDPEQIGRALKNVVGNAVDALDGEHGTIAVRTEDLGDGFEIVVDDDGPGFAEGARARALEPYFTTREAGTGLGLAIVDRIVSDHGGFVALADRPGGGARVRIRLPWSAA